MMSFCDPRHQGGMRHFPEYPYPAPQPHARPRMNPTSDVFTCLFGDLFVKCFDDSGGMDPMGHHYMRAMDHSPTDGMGAMGKARKCKEDKYCGVCGDRALGYNFDAISCESCKAFFRRNAPKGLDYFKCPYEEKCKMDVSNRRFCKRCRLRKCFEIGMRKEYILTDEEKLRKRQRIEENRKFRDVDRTKMQSMDITTSSSATGAGSMMMGGVSAPPGMGMSMGAAACGTHRLRMLDPEEEHSINEVVAAYHASLEIVVESDISRDGPTMTELVNIAEISVRRVIDMSKKIKSFKVLSQQDQISLLKGGSIELLIIRSVINFDKDKMQFLDPHDKEKYAMSTDQLKFGLDLFEEHMRFVKNLTYDLQADETVLILLLMIALYSPDRPQVTDKHYVSDEQERYALLLLRYLESKHPPHVIRWMYPKLLMKLTDIRNLNEEHSQVLLKINPEGIQPLMKEVLDLNPEKNKVKPPGSTQQQSSSSSPPPPTTDTTATTTTTTTTTPPPQQQQQQQPPHPHPGPSPPNHIDLTPSPPIKMESSSCQDLPSTPVAIDQPESMTIC